MSSLFLAGRGQWQVSVNTERSLLDPEARVGCSVVLRLTRASRRARSLSIIRRRMDQFSAQSGAVERVQVKAKLIS
jgi:hypothetical protein